MVLWRDYLMGSYVRAQSSTRGLFLWSMKENSVFYFEVCHSFFPFPDALNPNARQMEFVPFCYSVVDDLLFIKLDTLKDTRLITAYRCVHIPTLVTSTHLPGGALSLMENAFDVLQPRCVMELRATGSLFSVHTKIYSIPACLPTHPRYRFVIKRFPVEPHEVELEVLEVEIDLSIAGPIKIFGGANRQHTVHRPAYPFQDSDNDPHLYLQLGREGLARALNLRFLRVGKPGKARLVRLGGVDEMYATGINVDRDAGCVIIWTAGHWLWSIHGRSFIWWLDERKPGNMVHSRTKDLITSWSRGLLGRFG